LELAISRKQVTRVLYHALNEQHPSWRTIHPYILVIRSGGWYLIARDTEPDDFRFYRLERIHELDLLAKHFERKESFDVNTFFKQSFSVFRGESFYLKVRFTGKAARLAAEREWHEDIRLDWINENTLILQGPIVGEQEIRSWLLGLGEEAVVLEPESLRQSIQDTLLQTLKHYQSPDGTRE